jgi:Fic family protein
VSAREACTALRWHPALRRRQAQARAETTVRAARASAALDGADLPLEQVRALVGGAGSGPVESAVVSALRATAAAAEIDGILKTAPAQALARLHLAAAGPTSGSAPGPAGEADELGRPRPAARPPRDLVDLGVAPSGPELAERLDALSRLILAPTEAPALVLAAVVQGELLSLRPFTSGNGLVARAMFRALVVGRGLDPTGVAVPEVGLLVGGPASYVGLVAAYASGTASGLAAWLLRCAVAVEVGAREGGLVADAVQAGRL